MSEVSEVGRREGVVWKAVDKRGGLTSVACVHVGDQRRPVRVEVGNHLGVGTHVVEMGDAEVGLAEAGCCGAGAGLRMSCQLEWLDGEAQGRVLTMYMALKPTSWAARAEIPS